MELGYQVKGESIPPTQLSDIYNVIYKSLEIAANLTILQLYYTNFSEGWPPQATLSFYSVPQNSRWSFPYTIIL